MSPTHTYTVNEDTNQLSQEMEDDDICPVCDGECTCSNNRPISVLPNQDPALAAVPTSISRSTIPQPQSLKIKLTVPPNLLAKRRAPNPGLTKSKKPVGTTSVTGNDGETASSSHNPASRSQTCAVSKSTAPKRRGRPPKAIVAARENVKTVIRSDQRVSSTLSSQPRSLHPNKRSEAVAPSKNSKSNSTAVVKSGPKHKGKKPAKKSSVYKKRHISVSESSASDSSDDQDIFNDEDDVNDFDDSQSGVFPTFLSASALSSTSSNDSESSSLSDLDDNSDSSMEAEEEKFILDDERTKDRARTRRELLGDERAQKMRDPKNNWVIRPRKKSVGLSDAEMDVDTDEDATEDEDEDEAQGCADEDEDEVDGRAPSSYAGVATGWSEDEESSFDADLFFANLSSAGDTSSDPSGDEADDGDQSDFDAMSLSVSSLPPGPPPSSDFEVTHGWDGQMVFTNGLSEGQGVLDLDFEVAAAQQMLVDAIAHATAHDSDVDMTTSDVFDGEYEEMDDDELEETDGETTEEELVGPDGLPTARALRLLRLPNGISSIDPRSTMSPSVSPAPRRRRQMSLGGSPRPADILAGRVFWDESDAESVLQSPRSVVPRGRNGLPAMGSFSSPIAVQKCAIIDGSKKDIPSPFPPSRSRMRSTTTSRHGSISGLDQIFGGNMFNLGPESPFPLGASRDAMPSSPSPSRPIDIDDVLESSLIDSDPSSDPPVITHTVPEEDPRTANKDISRWNSLTVGDFRPTGDASSSSDAPETNWAATTPRVTPADAFAYSDMIKSSPLSAMLWPDKKKLARRRPNIGLEISPVILPVRDGDRTPIPPPHVPRPPPDYTHHQKTRKELRREKKMKRKNSGGPVHHQHHQHHYHQHYPNSKSRASSSVQRTGFMTATSSVPPLSL